MCTFIAYCINASLFKLQVQGIVLVPKYFEVLSVFLSFTVVDAVIVF